MKEPTIDTPDGMCDCQEYGKAIGQMFSYSEDWSLCLARVWLMADRAVTG